MSVIDNEDQKALAETVRRFVAERTPMSKVREVVSGPDSYDREVWSRMAGDLGLAGLCVPEEYGGVGAGRADRTAALRELGAGLVPSPLLASAVLAAGVLVALPDEAAKKEWLPRIADGSVVATVAVAEAGRWLPDRPATTASGPAGQVVLDGTKAGVLNGADADLLLVQAADGERTGLYLVQRGAAGLVATADEGIDPTTSTATVTFERTPAVPLAGDAAAALARARDDADLALAALHCGATLACLTMTTEYAKLRYTFGQPIGAYQGVKHRLADMYTAWALADAALRVAVEIADGGPGDLTVAAAAARALASPGYVAAARATMLLHGGIGFTWEHDAHFFYKNALAGNVLLGDPAERLDHLADALAI